eukprot:m.161219 g.161219  ORF g.161219 m.161219 type:complete len:261 (-) comp16373_c7_seq3:161-943(-)
MAALNVLLGCGEAASHLKGTVCISSTAVDGSVFLHHFINMYLKGGNNVVLVSFVQSIHHYQLIGKKMGHHVDVGIKDNKVLFIDGLNYLHQHQPDSFFGPPTSPYICNLRQDVASTFAQVNEFCDTQAETPVVIVVDGVAEAMAAGVDEQNMLLFVHQLQRLVEDREDNQSCLVFHVHQDTLPEGNETARPSLGKQLPYLANILLQVTALSTGASSDVHGVLSCRHRGALDMSASIRDVHFKAKETGISLFPIGAARGLL